MSETNHEEMARMMKKLRKPFGRKLYVRVYKMDFTEKKSDGGIILPQNAYEREIETGVRGRILKVGKGVLDPDLQPGVWVLVPRFIGTKIDANEDYVLLHEDSIIALLDEEETLKEIIAHGESCFGSVRDIVGDAPSAY